MFDLSVYMYLQYFDTVGWVFWPVKTVACIIYTVLVETLNGAQSINQWQSLHLCVMVVCTLKPQLFGTVLRTFSKKLS